MIAAGADGYVHVAWDAYDKGNYDVLLRSWNGSAWDANQPIADTSLYEAHPSIVVDAQNRLWASWNESGLNWGKDSGYWLPVEGTPLYEYRLMRVAVFDGQSWKVPVADINTSLPVHIDGRHNDFPLLVLDARDRVWLFGRHRIVRQRDIGSETPLHRAA